MSVICWDGKTMAADRQCTMGGENPIEVCKLRKINGDIVGATGGGSAAEEMFAWYESGHRKEDWPKIQDDKDKASYLFVVTVAGRLIRYEHGPTPYEVFTVPVAFGSGADAAWGAMLAGADARRAVEIASIVDIYCGCGVDTLVQEKEPHE